MKLSRGRSTQKLLIYIMCISQVFLASAEINAVPLPFKNKNNILVKYLSSAVWRSVLLITDKVDRQLLRQLSDASITFQLMEVLRKQNSSVQFKHFLGSQRARIVVYCNIQCQQQVVLWGYDLFHKGVSWLFVRRSKEETDVKTFSYLQKFIRVDSEVFAMTHAAHDKNFVVRVSPAWNVAISKSKVASYFQQSWDFHRERTLDRQLQEHVLLFGVFHEPPLTIIQQKGRRVEYGGLFVELVRILSKYTGFSYNFIVDVSGAYGSINDNGSWTGLVSMLVKKKIDVASMPLSLTKERVAAADYAAYVLEADTVGMFRKPSYDSATTQFFIYLRPFTRFVWFWISTMIALVVICLTSSTTSENLNYYSTLGLLLKTSTTYSFWTLITICMHTGMTHLPRKQSGRIIFIFGTLFLLVVNSTYNSLLKAFLTVKKEKSLFENFDDVLENPAYNFAVCDNSAELSALKSATEGIFHQIWRNVAADPTSRVDSLMDGIEKLYNEKYVFINAHLILDHFAALNCSLSVIKKKYMKMTAHLMFQKRSHYTDVFSRMLILMRSSGIVQKEQSKYFAKRDPSVCSNDKIITSIRILDTAGAPACFLIGLFTALLCLIIEIILDKRRQVRQTSLHNDFPWSYQEMVREKNRKILKM